MAVKAGYHAMGKIQWLKRIFPGLARLWDGLVQHAANVYYNLLGLRAV